MNQIVPVFKLVTSTWVLLAMLACMAAKLHAATNVVLNTDDLQQKINAAVPGDTLVVEGGFYGGNLTISNSITLVRSGATPVQLLGALDVQTTGTVILSQMNFVSGVSVSRGATVRANDSQFSSTLTMTDGKLEIRRCALIGALTLNNTDFDGSRVTNSSAINIGAPVNSGRRFVLTQSLMDNNQLLSVTGYKVWLGYNKLSRASFFDTDVTMIGNTVSASAQDLIFMRRGRFVCYNNLFNNTGVFPGSWVYGLQLEQLTGAEVVNSTIKLNTPSPIGVAVSSATGWVTFRGCLTLVSGNPSQQVAIGDYGSNQGIQITHCFFNGAGVSFPTLDCQSGDPLVNADFSLESASPCRNAGPPDAIYNDRDGTRNDIGFTGGPLYNPANYTTDLPMAFWLNTTPRKVLKGINNTIRVDAAAVAGH